VPIPLLSIHLLHSQATFLLVPMGLLEGLGLMWEPIHAAIVIFDAGLEAAVAARVELG